MGSPIVAVDSTEERRELITTVDGIDHLAGSVCTACGNHAFPVSSACSRCGQAAMEPVALPRRGRVWTWTVQRHQPKLPYRTEGSYEPFALGYVDLGPLKVESPLGGKPCDAWRIGDEVELSVAEDAGLTRFTFRPTAAVAADQEVA